VRAERIMSAMILMAVLGLVLVGGVTLTLMWGDVGYRPWPSSGDGRDGGADDDRPPVGAVVRQYLRGAAVALVAGVWTGLIVTGTAARLVMRLLAVTGGDSAQGRITEADEIVGSISLDGTIGLILFAGVLPGLLSAAIYVVGRRLLPGGRLSGLTFGLLHLVVVATRVDPLRPDNPDFDLVGPGWLALLSLVLLVVVHGMAVAAFADRYSRVLPPAGAEAGRAAWARAVVPLVVPVLLLVPGAALLVPLAIGLVATLVLSRIPPLIRALRSDRAVLAGRLAVGALALVVLPAAVLDLHDVVVRDDSPALAP
jgi:hypothetical protein